MHDSSDDVSQHSAAQWEVDAQPCGTSGCAPRAPVGMHMACVAPTSADGAHMLYTAMSRDI